MLGTLINVVAVIVGSSIGLLIGNRLTEKIRESVMTCLGLVTLTIALQNAFKTGNIVIPLLSLVFGAIIGELLDLDALLKRFGAWLQERAVGGQPAEDAPEARTRFINAFVTSSLIFCVGPLTILGSVQNGLNAGDIQLLLVKSILDFFASTAFAASLGVGVAFAAIPVLLLQGAFALVGIALGSLFAAGSTATNAGLSADNPYILEFTATGGLILIGLALILLNLKQPRVANFLPALLIAPLLVALVRLLGLQIPV